MSLPYLGFGAYIGIGIESTYGTAVARTRWMRPTALSLSRQIKNAVQADLAAEIDTMAPLDHYEEGEESGGSIDGYFAYNDYCATILLSHCLGANVNAGAGPYTHTMVPAKALPAGLTIEQGSKDYAEVFEGCKVNKITLTWEVGKVCTISAEIIGETSGGQTTVASPTFIVPTYSLHNQVGTLSWNSITSTLKKMVFTYNNNLERRQQLGSLLTLEPVRAGNTEIMLEVEQEKTALTTQAAYIARTQATATVVITSSASAALSIALNNALIDTYDDKVSDVGPVMERYAFRAFRDASAKGVTIIVTNANATAV